MAFQNPESSFRKVIATDKSRREHIVVRLTIVMVVMSIVYAILNKVYDFNAPWIILAGLALSGFGTYILSRLKMQQASRVFGLLTFNGIIYCVASSEHQLTNINLYFATAGTAALGLFDYTESKKAFAFIGLSFLLFLAAKYLNYSPLPERTFTAKQLLYISSVNLVVFIYVSSYLIVLLLRSNHYNKKSLKEQNVALTKSNKELDRFTYSSSHDLRAPLSSLLGLINLSEKEKQESTRNEYLKMMRKQIESMDRFIREIMDYSKNINQEVHLTEIGVSDQIKDILAELRYMQGAKEMDIQCEGIGPLIIRSDVTRLRIIFSNLISNAIKYRDASKPKCTLFISASPSAYSTQIDFIDNGIGIHPTHHSKILDMFYRAHETSIGSGLGLYITQETLATLGGALQFTSEVGKGSTFSITLPA